jgi:type IV secretion system protein VirD4
LLNEISGLAGTQKGKPLVSVFKLQHLNKEDGECLVMSGRHYPYFAHLADIDSYDNGEYTIRPISQNYGHINCKLPKFQDLLNDHTDNDVVSVDDEDEEKNLQSEFEKKFDELFGDLSESDDDN